MKVFVTNSNINRVSSFNKIVPVPEDLIDKHGEVIPTIRIPREFSFELLLPFGLIGPVKTNPLKIVKIDY